MDRHQFVTRFVAAQTALRLRHCPSFRSVRVLVLNGAISSKTIALNIVADIMRDIARVL
jgi:hypothetical protein